MAYLIGIDTGGTFTDAAVVDPAGRIHTAKVLSTPDHVESAVIASLEKVAVKLGIDLSALLQRTGLLAHGTTVGLNALLTGSGAQVAFLTTAGFESTVAIAKTTKLEYLPEAEQRTPVRWRKPDIFLRRTDVVGVKERVDVTGEVIVALDEDHLVSEIMKLVERGVESIAVSLLWSPVNPVHERRVAEIVAKVAPEVHVSLGSEIAPKIGEYERACTTLLDAYTAPAVNSYLKRLEDQLRQHGFHGRFVVMRMSGGVEPATSIRRHPIHTLRSGPTGGVAATAELGRRLGVSNLIATDVGGTSFDVGLVIGGAAYAARQPTIDRLPLAIPAVDITSIGTGGGSIAWVDPSLGTLRVGPMSAAASPGPACYSRGGHRPTLTDAAVVLGYIDRLGATLTLDRERAWTAIDTEIAQVLGIDVIAAAEGIVEVACAQMRDLIRRTTIQRGHDPSDFVLVAYGGAGPQYASRYAAELGVREVIIPAFAPEFSAYGATTSDLRAVIERDLRPGPVSGSLGTVVAALGELCDQAAEQIGGAAYVERRVGLRFYRQIQRVDLPLPDGPIKPERLIAAFHRHYEQVVGPGTASPDTPVEVVSVSAEAVSPVVVPPIPPSPTDAAPPVRFTSAWFFGESYECPVYDLPALGVGQQLAGPCLIESDETTVVLNPGQTLQVDPFGNLRIALAGSAQ